jgi:hypothetical protein
MRALMQNSVGPHKFQKIIPELQMLNHNTKELQYLDAVLQMQKIPTIRIMSNKHNCKFPPFSPFFNKQQYNGYIPSASYLSLVYTSLIKNLRDLMEKQTIMLDGKILKGDHSFKTIKYMGKVNNTSMFSALYTVCNEYEEIRLQSLVTTKALSHLTSVFNNMRENFTLLGHTQSELFYTDNVVGDQRFLESVLPSLKESVEHLKKSRSENLEDAKGLPEIVFPSNIKPKTIKETEEINNIANEILSLAETSGHV